MEAHYTIDESGRCALTQPARNRIKLATRELRRLTGLTIEEIAPRAGVSKSHWHNYENPAAPDVLPGHVALALELEAGHAPVTRAFAQLHGLPLGVSEAVGHLKSLQAILGAFGKEAGDALSCIAEASSDGTTSPNEARQVIRELGDLRRVMDRIELHCARVIAGDP